MHTGTSMANLAPDTDLYSIYKSKLDQTKALSLLIEEYRVQIVLNVLR